MAFIRLLWIFFFFVLGTARAEVSLYARPSSWSQDARPLISGALEKEGEILIRIVSDLNEVLLPWQKVGEKTRFFLFRPPTDLPTGIQTVYVKSAGKTYSLKLYIDHTSPAVSDISAKVSPHQLAIGCLALDRGSGVEAISLKGLWDGQGEVRVEAKDCSFVVPVAGKSFAYTITVKDHVGLETESPLQQVSVPEKNPKIAPPKEEKKKRTKRTKSYGPTPPKKTLPFLENCTRDIFVSVTKRFGQSGLASQGFGGDFEQMILGQVGCRLDKIRVDAQFDSIPRQPNKLLVEVSGAHEAAKIGNFSLGVAGSQFLSFQKEGEGLEVRTEHKDFQAKAIFTQSQSFSRTESFFGNDTKGPYRLNGFNIVPRSETIIQLDTSTQVQKTLVRDQDYIIDYFDGTVTFTEIKPSRMRFTASYEFAILDLLLRTGDIMGVQSSFQIGRQQKWNAVWLQEKSVRGGGVNSVSVTEDFLSFAKSGADDSILQQEYPLENWPLVANSELVQVANVVKQPQTGLGGDYIVDFSRGTLVFVKDIGKNIFPPGNNGFPELIRTSYTAKSAFTSQFEIALTNCNRGADGKITCNLPALPGSPTVLDPSFVRIWKKPAGSSNIFVKENFLSPLTSRAATPDYDFPDNNTLIFFPSSGLTLSDTVLVQERQLRAASSAQKKGDVSKTAFSLAQDWTFGSHFQLKWEFAQTQADKETLGQKVQEDVLVQANDIQPDKSAVLTLSRTGCSTCPLVPSSDSLQLLRANGTVVNLQRSSFNQSGSYDIDYNAGRVILSPNLSVVAGESVRATYSFFPNTPNPFTGSVQPVKGTALTTDFRVQYPFFNFQGGFQKVEPTFIPVASARPSPEDGALTFQVGINPVSYLQLNSHFSRRQTPEFDFNRLEATGKVTTSQTESVGANFRLGRWPQIGFTFQNQGTDDNRKTVDTSSTSWQLDLKKTFGTISSTFRFQTSETDNRLDNFGPRSENALDFGTTFAGKEKYNFNTGFQLRNISTPQPQGENSSTSAFRLDGQYRISQDLQLQSNLLVQRAKNNARPDGFTTSDAQLGFVQGKLRIPIPLLRGLKFQDLRGRFSLQQNGGETPARTTIQGILNFALALPSPAWSLAPSYSFSKSKRGREQDSTTQTFGANLGYHTQGKLQFGSDLSLNLSNTNTTTLQNNVLTSTGTNTLSTDFRSRFLFPRKLEWNFGYSFQKTSGVSQNTTTQRPTIGLQYTVGPKSTASLRTQWDIQNGKTIRRDLTGTWRQKISEIADLSVDMTSLRVPGRSDFVTTTKVEMRF